MIKLGLTGSIGMGKSATSAMFVAEGVPVYDADAAIHHIYKDPAVVALVEEAFPGSTANGVVDRPKLGAVVFADHKGLKALEQLVYPFLEEHRAAFFAEHAAAPVVVLDIPLLYETFGERQVDKVIVVSAPAEMQRERVLARTGMTVEKFESILSRQVPDERKRARADYVIDTSKTLDDTRAAVRAILKEFE